MDKGKSFILKLQVRKTNISIQVKVKRNLNLLFMPVNIVMKCPILLLRLILISSLFSAFMDLEQGVYLLNWIIYSYTSFWSLFTSIRRDQKAYWKGDKNLPKTRMLIHKLFFGIFVALLCALYWTFLFLFS